MIKHLLFPVLQTITGALVSNKTFTAIMEAAGVSVTWEGEGRDWKAAADAFEMMIAQFGRTRGDKTVRDWVGKVFGPLVVVAKRAFDEVTKQACVSHSSPSRLWLSLLSLTTIRVELVVVMMKTCIAKEPMTVSAVPMTSLQSSV